MTVDGQPRGAWLDGVLPLIVLLVLALVIGSTAVHAVTMLYLVFAAAMASGGADRPGEPAAAWRLYAIGTGALAVVVPLTAALPEVRPLLALPLTLLALGFAVHLRIKARHGLCRVGLLSACGRRAHDARVGRTLEAAALTLAAAVALTEPALFAVAGWLLTAAAVAERPEAAVGSGLVQPPATSTVT